MLTHARVVEAEDRLLLAEHRHHHLAVGRQWVAMAEHLQPQVAPHLALPRQLIRRAPKMEVGAVDPEVDGLRPM